MKRLYRAFGRALAFAALCALAATSAHAQGAAPTLTNGTVYIQGGTIPTVGQNNQLSPAVNGNTQTPFIFQVTYADADNTGPAAGGFVKATINGAVDVPMHIKAGDPQNWASGVVYVSDPTTLAAGQKAFHFSASDGTNTARLPAGSAEITGLTVVNLPRLSPPSPPPAADDGTLTPRIGPLSTTFTYQIVYTHADNTAPAYVRVFIDGAPFDMTRVGTNPNYAAGVTYQFQNRFQAGTSHVYHFEAADTVSTSYVAHYPATGELNGPTLRIASFTTPAFTPNPGLVGSPMTISGALETQPPLATQIGVQLVKPDGTGVTTSTTTNTSGLYSFTITPDQTGDWKVRLSWNGSQGTFDPVTTEFPFRVAGYTIALDPNVVDMIASPLVPVTPDPSVTFSPTAPNGTPVNVTVLDLIKWVPNVTNGTDQGAYRFLNTDASFPGITGGQAFWVKPSQAVVLNPRGTLWDQTQPYSIALVPGWNMIGSVYLRDINWSAVTVLANGTSLAIDQAGAFVRPTAWTYDKTSGGYNTVIGSNAVLQTGRGYWVRAFQTCQLILPPPGTRAAKLSRAAESAEDRLQIVARTGSRIERDNYVSLTASATKRMAAMEKPPYIGDYVTVRLLDTSAVQLPIGTRAAAGGTNLFVFEVVTDHRNADVTVQFPNVSAIGRKYELTLIDLANNSRKALAASGAITYNTGDNAAPRRFAVLIDRRAANSSLVIVGLRSSSRGPAGLTFTYTASGSATIRAQILGPTGQVIREIAQGRAATRGENSVTWDGRDNRGASAPSGTYILKLSATDDSGHAASAVLPITLVR